MFQNFLKKFSFYLPFLLPFLIPFSRAVADITIILVSILFIVHCYVNNEWNWIRLKWIKFAAIFWIYCLFIVTPLSINIFESFNYSVFFLRWPLFSIALCFWIFNEKAAIKKFLYGMLFVIIFLIADSWWQYFFEYDFFGNEKFSIDRLTGPFRRPYVGMWISKLSLFIPFLFLIEKFDKNSIYKFFILFLIIFLTIFISGERMALILTFASIFIYALGFYLNKYISIKTIILLLIIISIALAPFYFYDSTIFNRSFVSLLDKIQNWRNSDYGLVWESAYMVWMQHPFFGSGFHTYREACESLIIYGTADKPIGSGVCFHPHNITLELLSELGIFGFFFFYLMIIFIFVEFKSTLLEKNYLLFSVYLSIFLGCFFPISSGMSIFSNKLASIIWLLIGFTLAYEKIRKN